MADLDPNFVAKDIGTAGSVCSWHCDSNRHMNIRFYFAAFESVVSTLSVRLAMTDKVRVLHACEYHVRFHAELYEGAAYQCRYHVRPQSSELALGQIQVLAWLGNAFTPVAATCIINIQVCDGSGQSIDLSATELEKLELLTADCELPTAAQPRGISGGVGQCPTQQHVSELQLDVATRRRLQPNELDSSGYVAIGDHVGLISDGVPNMIASQRKVDRSNEVKNNRGGAAVEYRIVRINPVDIVPTVVTLYAGLVGATSSIMHFGHWLFDEATQTCLGMSEAVAVPLDLEKRVAVKVNAKELQAVQPLIKPDLGIGAR